MVFTIALGHELLLFDTSPNARVIITANIASCNLEAQAQLALGWSSQRTCWGLQWPSLRNLPTALSYIASPHLCRLFLMLFHFGCNNCVRHHCRLTLQPDAGPGILCEIHPLPVTNFKYLKQNGNASTGERRKGIYSLTEYSCRSSCGPCSEQGREQTLILPKRGVVAWG